MHVHLDPVGGSAGDMFIAAILDAWPDRGEDLVAVVRAAGVPESVSVAVTAHRDHALAGTRFQVGEPTGSSGEQHVDFHEIRRRLTAAPLPGGARRRALAIFTLLAEAESQVHGVPIDEVVFHELGAWDSIADVVGAAFLIDSLGPASWSVGALPVGSGRVRSAHGILPVPAPATVRLLEGLMIHDDGIGGERVTPTGAAILRHLDPAYGLPREPRRLARSGLGFGTRRLAGLSNVLRVLAFDDEAQDGGWHSEEIAVVRFEVDDQPAEDLAVGLDRLRALSGVVDVVQAPVYGKKGRMGTQVQILTRTESLQAVIRASFTETSTIGLRWQVARRAVLARRCESYVGRDQPIEIKCATRPSGEVTGKAEIDDVAAAPGGFAERTRRRREAEDAVLDREKRGE
ncbi:MAG: LarC family nickel insertion protein [bacterium]|nr:LarC family nickel insertion protein [bacterium]